MGLKTQGEVMDKSVKEFSLRTRSKLLMVVLFLMVGGPMLYAAYLNFKVGEMLFSGLMVILFFLWAVVILIANGYKITLTDQAICREGLISPSIIAFAEVKAIHFGSTWSNFYVESEDNKIFFGKDFENYDDILRGVVKQVHNIKDPKNIDLLGDKENIRKFTDMN